MYVKIEPSGCSNRKGMVQIRFCMYLEPKDYGYDRHHVQLPDGRPEDYPGKVGEYGIPIDHEDYMKWYDGLPKKWQNNPFHNHFIRVPPDTSDEEIMNIGEAFLHEAYVKWAQDLPLDLTNNEMPFKEEVHDNSAVDLRVQQVKNIKSERKA